jgi:hypothetical protein
MAAFTAGAASQMMLRVPGSHADRRRAASPKIQVSVSAATISRYLSRAGLVTPDPAKRPRSSYLRFEAAQPNECRQAGFTRCPLADGTSTETLSWVDDHSRYALPVTAHIRVTARPC